eukprot:450777_1
MPYPNQPNHKNGRMRHPQSRARPPINNSNDMQHPQVHRQSRPTPPINNSNDMQHPQVHRQSRPTPPINNSNDMQHPQVHGQSRANSNDMQDTQSNITNNVIHVSIEQLLFTQLNQINSDCLALISNRPRASFNPAGPNPNLAKEIYFLNLYRKLENARTDLVMNCMFNGRKITKALQ